MAELKPCPFCGGKGRLIKRPFSEWSGKGPYDFTVYCYDCGAGVRHSFPKEKEAVEAWNRRAGEQDG